MPWAFFFRRTYMNNNEKNNANKHQIKTAILIDGGFYRKRAKTLFGEKLPAERAKELSEYCYRHLYDKHEQRYLYRIFYYDCPPSDKNIFNPLKNANEHLKKSEEFSWMNAFLDELKHQRKFALRLGCLSESQVAYHLSVSATKDLLMGKRTIQQLTQKDLVLNIEQKGVDMRIGVDISSLAFKHQVNQIILISGDSDFVPAAKQARREGIDFILDPMHSVIKGDLFEHIDGIRTPIQRKPPNQISAESSCDE